MFRSAAHYEAPADWVKARPMPTDDAIYKPLILIIKVAIARRRHLT
jgi:hypothetical protein